MSGGYRVDLTALQQAAEGVNDVLAELAQKKVSDISSDKSAFGHDGLGDTVSDFCDRWQRGVDNLAKDGQEVASRLANNLDAYAHVERALKEQFGGVLSSPSGPDPAAQ